MQTAEKVAPTVRKGMYVSSHAVGIVYIDDSAPDGTLLVARMEYSRKGRTSIRHIVETGEVGESIRGTLSSGRHEAAADVAHFSQELVTEEPILYEFSPDDNDPDGTHLKAWYIARPKGKLRNHPLPDGIELLGPITMVEVLELLKETEGRTVKGHVLATYAALVALAVNPRVYNKYFKHIDSAKSQVLTPEQQSAIDAYPGNR